MGDIRWKDAVKNAKHHLAIGQKKIYLYCDNSLESDMPWAFVTKVGDGCCFRLSIPTSIDFTAEHPKGLTFNWSVDIESSDANGAGKFLVDTKRLAVICSRLPADARKQLSKHLQKIAKAVRDKGNEYYLVAQSQFDIANSLETL